jgi:ABC-type branched-subunit amino acid transport system substrate-binding protein
MRPHRIPSLRRVSALGATAALLTLAACSSSGGAKTSEGSTAAQAGGSAAAASAGSGGSIPDGPIKIGMVAEQSGASSAIGNYQVSVQKALVQYINDHGGIAGHQVELVIENNQSDAAIAVTAARKLVQEHVAGVVFTGLGSSGKDQVVSILAKARIPTIDPEPLGKYDDPKQFPYFFTDNPIDPNAMVAEAAFAKKKGFDKVGQLGDSTPFAKSLEDNFSAKAKDVGITIVKTVDYPTTATDMTTQLAQLKQAGAETLGLWCEVGCGKVYDGLRQLNWSPNILTTEVLYYSGFESVKALGAKTFGDCPISVAEGEQPNPTLADIIRTVAAKSGGINVTAQGIPLNADSWLILKYGIEKANSLDGEKVRDAIETISDMSFSDPDVKYTISNEHHAGFDAANPEDISMCSFDKLGALSLPVKAD